MSGRSRSPEHLLEADMTLQSEAIMLLTVSFGKHDSAIEKPLSTTEWNQLHQWLEEQKFEPAELLQGDPAKLLHGWDHHRVTLERIEALLKRGANLGFSLEKWQRAGLWELTCVDPEYPTHLKSRLGPLAPPVLFGCGDKSLLGSKSIAVVGSRRAKEVDLQFADRLARRVANLGRAVVSGGAQGVDSTAMLGALDEGGTAIGVVGDNLLRSATSANFRHHLISGSLTLISPFNPEVSFHVGNAMSRNKIVYCLSEAGVVVSSSYNQGGTWAGAVENLKKRWVPLWVKRSDDRTSGNSDLIQGGGLELRDPNEFFIDYVEELLDTVKRILMNFCMKPRTRDEIADALQVSRKQADAWLKQLVDMKILVKHSRPARYVNPKVDAGDLFA